MTFLLGVDNVFEYLIEHNLCDRTEILPLPIESKSSRNLNLVVSLKDNRYLIVKQEPHDVSNNSIGLFLKEWRIQELFNKYLELNQLKALTTEAIHYERQNSILVFKYLKEYGDLNEFYRQAKIPTEIAATIGTLLATVHSSTIDCQKYKDFFAGDEIIIKEKPNFLYDLEPITPEIFASVCVDNLKFFELFQRFERLKQAIAELNTAFECCCLTHNDIKLDNFLLHNQWQHNRDLLDTGLLRLIDWENCNWGDPAFDLGRAIACYLKMWLNSIAIAIELDVKTALASATVPLDALQPSLVALIRAYCEKFPQILERRSDFLLRVMQYAGYAIIANLRIRLEYHSPFGYPELFGNQGICKLQVAKTLLCTPERSLPIVFGKQAAELTVSNCLSH